MTHLPTTTAGVRYLQQLDFEDARPGIQIWLIEMKFDGPTLSGSREISFAGNATAAQKRTAARLLINEEIKAAEIGHAGLTDASIQISGQPT